MDYISILVGNASILINKDTGDLYELKYKEFKMLSAGCIWKLKLKHNNEILEFDKIDDLRFNYNYIQSGFRLIWSCDTFEVTVNITGRANRFLFDISVTTLSNKYSIYEVVFPIIKGLKPIDGNGEEDYLVLPWQNGLLINDPIHSLISKEEPRVFWSGRGIYKYENDYPAQYSYQFTAYYNPQKYGIYFGTEDSDVYLKTMGFYYNIEVDGFDLAIINYPEQMGLTTKYTMPYSFILSFFEGDWQVAARLYREWAIKQKWCNCRLADKNLPGQIKNIDLWRINHTDYALGTRTQEYFDTSVIVRNKLSCNLALHWYGWNMGEHDINYPEYISDDNKVWNKQLSKWNEKFECENIVKIPYVNGRLWDVNTKSWNSEKAYKYAIKGKDGELIEEPWKNNNLRPMCPTVLAWQDKVINFKSYILNNGFNGLYIDQIASYNAALCFDEQHQHPLGGGNWWNNAYHEMILKLRALIGKDKILTTESCCECYIDLFDIFLILDPNLQKHFLFDGEGKCDSIPLFSMIYGDYALSYGSICRLSDTIEEFEFNFIRNLLWGMIPTIEGFSMDQINDKNSGKYFEIIKEGVDFFKENKELFLYGRLVQIPILQVESMKIIWQMADISYEKEYPSILMTIWTGTKDDSYCLLYNFFSTDQEIIINNCHVKVCGRKLKIIEIDK
ncbi:MAG: DUF6259 domain-containing protein [Eubacteriales bacterium]|nr:DUF6259 domain-containing protein [Eubacteriales bacterium]